MPANQGGHGRNTVVVTYNGVDHEVAYTPQENMGALLAAAVHAFDITVNPHIMALWSTGNVELPITGSVADAGIIAGQTLVLRPSAVRGG